MVHTAEDLVQRKVPSTVVILFLSAATNHTYIWEKEVKKCFLNATEMMKGLKYFLIARNSSDPRDLFLTFSLTNFKKFINKCTVDKTLVPKYTAPKYFPMYASTAVCCRLPLLKSYC